MTSVRRFRMQVQAVRFLIFLLGVFLLIGYKVSDDPQPSYGALIFALLCVIIGFPQSLFNLLSRLVMWLLRLLRIVKPKPVPMPELKITVEWGDDPATDKQLGFIRHLGGNPPDGMTKSEASNMINTLLAEKQKRT